MMGDWVVIPEFPRYSVSSDGRIRGIRCGDLKPGLNRDGYLHVCLRHEGVKKTVAIHGLIARAFIGPRRIGYVVNHKNGNKADPRAENLEYVTPSANNIHASENGLGIRGEKNGYAKLTESQAGRIKELAKFGYTNRELAEEYGVSVSTVHLIRHGKRWGHVKSERKEKGR